jgi:peptide/nickel transport system substrate-binding protein
MSQVARIVKTPSLYTVAGSFNTNSGPMRDERIRQALNYAIDKRELIRYDLLGNGTPIHTLTLKGHESVTVSTGMNTYDYDPVKARALLKAAGIDGELKISVLEVKGTRTAKIIAKQWKRVGVEAEVVSTTDAMVKDDIKKRHWDVFLGGCPDPMYHSFFIQSIFLYSRSPYSLIQDAELDHLIDQVVGETDPQEQSRRSGELAAYVNQKALTIYTYQRFKTEGVARDVTFEPSISSMPYFRTCEVKHAS